MPRIAEVHRFPMTGPTDVLLIRQAIDKGNIEPENIVAILGKTEGNGCVNDFTRGYGRCYLGVSDSRFSAIAGLLM